MPRLIKKTFAAFFVFAIILASFPAMPAKAVVDFCTANVNPTQVNSGTPTNLSIVVSNGPSQTIVWVRITRPSTNFTLTGAIATGWTRTITPSNAIFTGSLAPNGGKNFILTNVQVAAVQAPAADWIVEVSDDISGANPTSCTGTLGTQIGNPDSTPPVISDISVSSITTTSAIINWVTDEVSDSKVNYGLNQSYGSNISNSSLVTNHSVSLTGLNPNTPYHFQVESKDPSNNLTTSADNTFLTESEAVVTPEPTNNTNTTPEASSTNPSLQVQKPPSIPSDTSAPIVTLNTKFDKPFKDVPAIGGKIIDNNIIYLVEYSTDAGLNWLPVDKTTGLNTREVNFEFKPANLPDANYPVLVRAFDQNNNEGRSDQVILIIDEVLPVIGSSVMSYGPQFSYLDENVIRSVKGVDQKITLSAIGGPTNVSIKATSNKESKTFTLTKSKDQNLWSGVLAFDKAGQYSLEAFAIDGAKNKAEKELNQVFVAESSKVLDKSGNSIKDAEVTVYYFDEESSSWVIWDGASFGQQNPQSTNDKGEFNLFLPEGKYYLVSKAEGFAKFTSNIFTQEKEGSLATDIYLKSRPSLKIWKWTLRLPDFNLESFSLTNKTDTKLKPVNKLEGKTAPDFNLPTTRGTNLTALELSGKPTLLSFISTWSPETEEQIAQLEQLSSELDYNIFALVSLETLEKVKAYQKIGDYKIEFIVDSNAETLKNFGINNVPTHVFIRRDQTINRFMNGLFSKIELQKEIDKL